MISNGYGWCAILIIEDWDFRVVFINATREYESIFLRYSSCILWQKIEPVCFMHLHYYIKDQNEQTCSYLGIPNSSQ